MGLPHPRCHGFHFAAGRKRDRIDRIQRAIQSPERVIAKVAMIGNPQRHLRVRDLENCRRRTSEDKGEFPRNAPDGRLRWKNGRFPG